MSVESKISNAETRAAMAEVETMAQSSKDFNSAEELFDTLEEELDDMYLAELVKSRLHEEGELVDIDDL